MYLITDNAIAASIIKSLMSVMFPDARIQDPHFVNSGCFSPQYHIFGSVMWYGFKGKVLAVRLREDPLVWMFSDKPGKHDNFDLAELAARTMYDREPGLQERTAIVAGGVKSGIEFVSNIRPARTKKS